MKKIIYFYSDSIESLFYCVIEHNGMDPYEIIEKLVSDMNILVLGDDGPEQVTPHYTMDLIEWGKKEGIPIKEISGYPWIETPYWQKIYNYDSRICEGNILLFAIKPPENDKIPRKLPFPSGFLGNKLKKSDIAALDTLLEKNDVYVYDDFVNCLFVTKSESIHNDIIYGIQKLNNS